MGSPATISTVGSAVTNSGTASGTASITVSPSTVGDAMLYVSCNNKVGTGLSSLSGGGVSSWTSLAEYFNSTTNTTMEFWLGQVVTTGSSAITCSEPSRWSVLCQEFTCTGVSSATTWAADGAGSGILNTTSSKTCQFVTLTPSGLLDAFIGQCLAATAIVTSGQTAGYTLVTMPPMVNFLEFVYNPSVSGAQSPEIQQTTASESQPFGVLISATNPTPNAVSGDLYNLGTPLIRSGLF